MHGCRKSQQLSLGSALRVQSIYYNYSTQPSFLIKRSWGHSQPPTIRAIPWDRKGKDWILKEASKIGRFSVLLRRNTQLLGSASITRSGPFIVIVSIPIRRVRFQIQRFFYLRICPSPQTLSVVGCAKQPIPLYDDSVTFDTLHLVARNLDFRLSLVQLDWLVTLKDRALPLTFRFIARKD